TGAAIVNPAYPGGQLRLIDIQPGVEDGAVLDEAQTALIAAPGDPGDAIVYTWVIFYQGKAIGQLQHTGVIDQLCTGEYANACDVKPGTQGQPVVALK